jgi:predicted Zn-dependent protease
MALLQFPDRHYLNAAIGWLLLGNTGEAKAQLDLISPLGRLQPDAMMIRWQLFVRLAQWDQAHHLARAFTRLCPMLPAGWVCLSYTLYRMNRMEEAWEVLLAKLQRFPKFSGIPYLLACYAWRSGNRREARKWLARSALLGGPTVLSTRQLNDCSRLLVGHSTTGRKKVNRKRGGKRPLQSRGGFRSPKPRA